MHSPTRQLIQAMQEIIDGQFPEPVETDSTDEIGELAGKFNEMVQILVQREASAQQQAEQLREINRELIQAKQSQVEFLSDVSHELRTPLTSIRSFCDLLLMFGDDDPETREEFLESIIESCDRLTNLINDVLDSSKMQAGKMGWNAKRIDLIEIIDSSVRVMTGMVQEKGLEIVNQFSAQSFIVEGDRDRLVQVVTNLINNAVKFTSTGQITISAEHAHQRVKVSVADTGKGIAPEHQDMIFERFIQVTSQESGKPAGTGLGLAICREIVEHHGGEIWVDSELGRGSTFFFTLPVLPDDESNDEV
ncbi:MAG: HAMP domain-containing sensor histidine kinase [Candidatus Poribacteria bacterium]|nr:HAMP domain-containing sensor histidine kinase [Candidatus Poribacteria bacterium]